MSALVAAISGVVHQWFEEHREHCDGHGLHMASDCELLADRIATDLDWPDVDL